MAQLSTIVQYLDTLLKPHTFQDWSGAHNGLQYENDGQVLKVGAAVDSHIGVLEMARDQKIDLLIVHHGLFWMQTVPWTKGTRKKMQILEESNLAVYSSHLPLDAHAKYGNNILLAQELGFTKSEPFFEEHGTLIGRLVKSRISFETLSEQVSKAISGHRVVSMPFGPKRCEKIGIVSGGAGAELAKAASLGLDTFITGEGPHWTFGLAQELGVNALCD